MPTLIHCPRGHAWEETFDEAPSMTDGRSICPVCGEMFASGLVASTSIDAPLADLSNQASAAPAPAANATVALPGLADEVAAPAPPALPDANATVPPAAPSKKLPRPTLVNPEWPTLPGYEILEELGRGGMGVVYKARQVRANRIVALKMILSGSQASERDRARFRSEAEAIARLQHPNIVQIFEVGEHNGSPYFSLEFVGGGSLADHLRGTPLSALHAAQLLETLARAMHFAHQQGIVHRDLKPANILLLGNGERGAGTDKTTEHRQRADTPPSGTASFPALSGPSFPICKITDFGLAKMLDSAEVEHTRSGVVVGTPGYMAPEQALGRNQDIGPCTDVYALGVLLYQMMTGQQPFQGEMPMEVLIKVTSTEPVPPSRLVPRLPRDLETICLKCLEKAPARRYASANDLADDLHRFLHHEPILARPVGPLERGWRLVKRRPAMAALLAVAVVASLTLIGTVAAFAQAEQRRHDRAHAEVRDLILRGRQAFEAGNWDDARNLLSTAQKRARNEDRLGDLAPEADELLARAEGQLAARATYRKFQQRRDEALFQATLASGASSSQQRRAVLDKVRSALALVGAADGPVALGPFFTQEEKSEIQRGCFELLLVLAEATAQPQPHHAPADLRRHADEALAILDRAKPLLAASAHAYHLQRARYLDQQGDSAAAQRERRSADRITARSAFDHYLIGTEHYRQGDAHRAHAALTEALRLQPGNFWARYFLALCFVRLGQPMPACVLLTTCLSQQPRVVWIYLLRGFVQGQLGEHASAEADFQTALQLLKDRPDAGATYVLFNNRAVTRIGQKRLAEAEQDLRAAIALQPGQYQAYVTLAQVYQEQKKRKEAIEQLGRALAAAAPLVQRKEAEARVLVLLYRQRSRFHLTGGDHESALRDLEEALAREEPGSAALARLERERGHLLYRLARYEAALGAYDSALAAQPRDAESWRWRGQVLLKLQRHEGAAAAFDRYFKEGGKPTAQAYRCRALAQLKRGNHQSALGDFTRAIDLDPADALLWVQRGQAYLACQAGPLAVKDFDEAIRRGAKGLAHLARGLAHLQAGKYTEAVADAETAVGLAPSNARATYDAACLIAQAAGQVGTGASTRSGELELRRRYQERAVELLRNALALMPAAERASFWNNTVRPERTLLPIRHTTGYEQMQRQYRRKSEG
jgi:serine/threonine protein kinase/Tfp pilus assembly protein PilF